MFFLWKHGDYIQHFPPGRMGTSAGSKVIHRRMLAEIIQCRVTINMSILFQCNNEKNLNTYSHFLKEMCGIRSVKSYSSWYRCPNNCPSLVRLSSCISTLCGLVTPYVAEIWVNIGSGNGLLPDGTKPLPEPMLTDHQRSPVTSY